MRILLRSLVLLLLALAAPAAADPADIDAAARGVVRVVLIAERAGEVTPVSHGSGFTVSSTHIVTNAHVIQEALQDDTLRIGVVPSEGERGTFARIIAISPRNDLALIEITKGALRLPPLTLAGGVSADAGEVTAVGYPMNVDLAQGLDIADIFRAQPPVKSRGFLSGQRLEAEQAEARERLAERAVQAGKAREAALLTAQMDVITARENAMALALLALLTALGSGYAALQWRSAPETRKRAGIAAVLAGAALIGAVVLWLTRPGVAAIEDRVTAALSQQDGEGGAGTAADPTLAADGALICTLVPERSRVTTARTDDVAFDWAADGCVNTRTQYGLAAGGEWNRVLVLEDEAAVAVNRYDPATRTFRTDRYLLGKAAMDKVLAARGQYAPPACRVSEAARKLGEQQSAITALLPETPNERLVYSCGPKAAGARELAAP
jgi:hypothetical protein